MNPETLEVGCKLVLKSGALLPGSGVPPSYPPGPISADRDGQYAITR